jgi:2-haloacid dehalogenase
VRDRRSRHHHEWRRIDPEPPHRQLGLGDHISFVSTSEACGYAKPDSRFFDYAAKMARSFAHHETVIVGDRLDADILGANRFGIDSCWFNPGKLANASEAVPTCEVGSLHEIVPALKKLAA